MITPLLGLLTLIMVGFVALSERSAAKLGFLDPHAAFVVFGGVIGSLLLAIDRRALWRMLQSLRELLPSTSTLSREQIQTAKGLEDMRGAWREGRRATILEMADRGSTLELRVAADALLRQLSGATLDERFAQLRSDYMHRYGAVIEGWEMVSRLAPSFGMVGTVTGMVQLFRNMAENSSNLGGSMAMALLATLYGITTGAAIGGPMSSRVNNQLNDRLTQLELLEKTVAGLVSESRAQLAGGAL